MTGGALEPELTLVGIVVTFGAGRAGLIELEDGVATAAGDAMVAAE